MVDLHEAAALGNIEKVRELLAQGADSNVVMKDPVVIGENLLHVVNASPLIAAVAKGHVEIVRLLLQHHADPNRKASEGFTPLILAAVVGDPELIRELSSAGAGLDVRNDYGDSPLFAALNFHRWGAARELVRLGAPMTDRDGMRKTPLLRVAEIWKHSTSPLDKEAHLNGMLVLAAELIDAGCDLNGPGSLMGTPPLLMAAESDRTEMARLLLEKGADPNGCDQFGATPLAAACTNLGMTRLLLDFGAKADQADGAGRNALFHAVRLQSTEVARVLIAAGADANRRDIEGRGALDLAAEAGDRSLYNLLVEAGGGDEAAEAPRERPRKGTASSPSRRGSPKSPAPSRLDSLRGAELLEASSAGDSKRVDELLAEGADPNFKSSEGKSAHWIASEGGWTGIVKALLDAGANPRAKDGYGAAALHAAARGGHAGVVKALIDAGADKDLEKTTDFGDDPGDSWTPLLAAAASGNRECVRVLLDAGAKIEFKSKQRQTPLLAAALQGHGKVVELLLERGARKSGVAEDVLETLEFPERMRTPGFAKQVKSLQKIVGVPPLSARRFRNVAAFDLSRSPLVQRSLKQLRSAAGKKRAAGPSADPSELENLPESFLKSLALEKTLHEVIRDKGDSFLEAGLHLVYHHTLTGDLLVLVPTANPFAAVASLGPGPKGIPATLDFLRKVSELAPWRLHGAGADTLMIRFTKRIADPEGLAKKIYSFRADERGVLIDGEVRLTETIRELADELKGKNPIVRLWWD